MESTSRTEKLKSKNFYDELIELTERILPWPRYCIRG